MRRFLISVATASIAVATSVSAETIAITNAHIYSMGKAGEIASGTVILTDGKIAAIGANVKAPTGAHVIDAAGRIVTPGLFLTGSDIGSEEISGVEQTNDSGVQSGPLSAGFDVQYSLNPDSTLIPIERLTGATSALVTPTLRSGRRERNEKLFAGQAAVIRLGQSPNLLSKAHAAMVTSAGEDGAAQAGGARGAFIIQLKGQLAEARAFQKNVTAFDQNRTRATHLSREDLEALVPVVNGKEPLLIDVHRAGDLRMMMALARDEKISIVISGAEEGWRVADELAASKTPVMIDTDEDLPVSFESLSATLENAARLQAAGVQVIIHGPGLQNGGKAVRLAAGRAVSRGMPWGAALASITAIPARVFGVADQTGALDIGKDADLVVWGGDPLDTSGNADLVLIKGVEQSKRSRQLDLRDRYLKPDNGLPPQYH